MPYLQFDVPGAYDAETKRRLAGRVGRAYAEVMQTTPAIVKVAFRELGAANLFRCREQGAPEAVVVLMCDEMYRHGALVADWDPAEASR